MLCPNCNLTVRDIERFCRYCGAALTAEKQVAPAPPPPEPAVLVAAPVPVGPPKVEPKKPVCPSCGADVIAGTKFCRKCGGALMAAEPVVPAPKPVAQVAAPVGPPKPEPQKAVCPSCGADVIAGAKFCSKCGATITAPVQQAKPATPPAPHFSGAAVVPVVGKAPEQTFSLAKGVACSLYSSYLEVGGKRIPYEAIDNVSEKSKVLGLNILAFFTLVGQFMGDISIHWNGSAETIHASGITVLGIGNLRSTEKRYNRLLDAIYEQVGSRLAARQIAEVRAGGEYRIANAMSYIALKNSGITYRLAALRKEETIAREDIVGCDGLKVSLRDKRKPIVLGLNNALGTEDSFRARLLADILKGLYQ